MIIKELSIIFPIYNEENRLKRNLYKIINKYLDSFKKKYIKNIINYIYYKKNRGKGSFRINEIRHL